MATFCEMIPDSLSKPPATERIKCAGAIAMKNPAATAALPDPVRGSESVLERERVCV